MVSTSASRPARYRPVDRIKDMDGFPAVAAERTAGDDRSRPDPPPGLDACSDSDPGLATVAPWRRRNKKGGLLPPFSLIPPPPQGEGPALAAGPAGPCGPVN